MFKKGMDYADRDDEGKVIEKNESETGSVLTPAELKVRVERLIDTSCYAVFQYVSQGLFEKHKLIFATQLCFRVLARRNELDQRMFDFLIRGPKNLAADNPLAEWLDNSAWGAIQALKEITEPVNFEPLAEEMISSAKRFREWYELERPEDVGMPGDSEASSVCFISPTLRMHEFRQSQFCTLLLYCKRQERTMP
jgi:dynein heavy chain